MSKEFKKFLTVVFFIIFLYLYLKDEGIFKETKAVVNLDGKIEIDVLDVGQADSILIMTDNKYALIDAGNREDASGIVSYLNDKGISSFEYVFTTHPHEDHIGGMSAVIDNFDIKNFYMPNVITTTKVFENTLLSLKNKNMSFKVPNVGDVLELGDASIEVIYLGSDKDDLNNCSIVLKLTYGNNSFLFMGDAETKVENKILNKDLSSSLLKVSHHGSNSSTSAKFLDKVNPKYAVISVGKDNSYNHPSSKTINRLKKYGINTYRTDELGTIIITSDGNDIDITNKVTNINWEG